MSSLYPDRPITEEKRTCPPCAMPPEKGRQPQVASMCELIASRLNEQDKLLHILREKLSPILAPMPKEEESANKVENAMVPLAEGLRDIARKISQHNGLLDGLISSTEL